MSIGTAPAKMEGTSDSVQPRRICYFGTYSPRHTRNAVNIEGLKKNGCDIVECRSGHGGLRKYWDLFARHRKIRGSYDVMIVGFSGHAVMPLAWALTRFPRRSLVFDAFTSAYDSAVLDRKSVSKWSVGALKYWLVDWLSCHLADTILMDTEKHAAYMRRTFRIAPDAVQVLPIGCLDTMMHPRPPRPPDGKFVVHFHGNFIPTQGVRYILGAAKLLAGKGVTFRIIGPSRDYAGSIAEVKRLGLGDVQFSDYMPYGKLAECIASADICLGAFGDTEKAKRTSAFKIVEAMAMRKAVVTGESPALREFSTDRKDILFCRLADAEDLARKIMELKADASLRERIAEQGFELYKANFTPARIGAALLRLIREV